METSSDFRIVFVTNDSYDSSYQMAKIIINEHLAACCTIIPNCLSIFGWQGTIHERNEFVLMLKTSIDKLDILEQRILELHQDEVPEILAIKTDKALGAYLSWMNEALKLNVDDAR